MSRRSYRTQKAPAPIGPYEQAVEAGDHLYVSGQVALDASTGEMRNSSIEEETHQVMRNISAVLEEAGASIDQIIKCSIFLTDLDDFGTVNDTYGGYFKENYPSRECVQVSRLPKGARVEISCIAYRG